MIQFFGNEVVSDPPVEGALVVNIAKVFGVSEERCKLLVDALVTVKEQSRPPADKLHGMEAMGLTPPEEMFQLHRFFSLVDVDTISPGELVFVGMVFGKLYAQMENASMRLLEKHMETISKDPAKLAAMMVSMTLRDHGHDL